MDTRVPADAQMTGLTYEPFYGLKEKPFSLTSDARFFYQSRSHAPAFDGLLNAIKRRESLNVLTGDIGTGKTTLCRAVLQNLDRKTFSAFVRDPFASREDLLKVLLTDFGVASIDDMTSGRLRDASRTELSYLLHEFLGTLAPLQAFAVVLIDEAQNLSVPLLDEVRILSDADGQLQVVLVGQLELRDKLKLPEMRQLDQRVSMHCHLQPLDRAGVAGYISHRLQRAGGTVDRVSFTGDAVDAIYERSRGVPRVINKLCDRALHLGSSRRLVSIDRAIVEAANADAAAPLPAPEPAPVVPPVLPPVAAPSVAPPAVTAPVAPLSVAPPAVTAPVVAAPVALPAVTAPVAQPAVSPPVARTVVTAPEPPPAAVARAAAPAAPAADESRPRADDALDLNPLDTWLKDIEDRTAENPSAWRERWTPNDLAMEPEPEPDPERPARFRIRIGSGRPTDTADESAQREWTRRFEVLVLGVLLFLLAVIAGPSTWNAARGIPARFAPPPPPPAPAPPPLHLAPLRLPHPIDPLAPDPDVLPSRGALPRPGRQSDRDLLPLKK
jgi:type II secretory pathway predicted ATPase ExeA